MKCGDIMRVELVWWLPKRSHAFNRARTLPVIGVTNFDVTDGVYYAIFEVDCKTPDILQRIRKLEPALIIETMKGYHVYLSYKSKNPLKVIHYLYRTKVADRGQLKLARMRANDPEHPWGPKLVLRVSPKYPGVFDLKPIHVERLEPWHEEVLELIERLNGGGKSG